VTPAALGSFALRCAVGVAYLWWHYGPGGGVAVFLAGMTVLEALAYAARRYDRKGASG
jgi:hypothetical protein